MQKNEAVADVVARALKLPRERIADDLEYGTVQQWDSLSHVELMLRLEEEFGLEIAEDTMVELTSVAAIKDFVHANA